MTSAQVMELTEKEQNIFVFEVLYNIYNSMKEIFEKLQFYVKCCTINM